MTHTQTQDSFLRHNSQGTLAVLSPSPYSREEIGSHKYMPVAPWSLSLGNERKHSITIFLELCPHGRDSSVLSFLLRYDPHFKKNMFRESYQQAYLVFWANQKRKLTSKKEKCRRIIACHRTQSFQIVLKKERIGRHGLRERFDVFILGSMDSMCLDCLGCTEWNGIVLGCV